MAGDVRPSGGARYRQGIGARGGVKWRWWGEVAQAKAPPSGGGRAELGEAQRSECLIYGPERKEQK